MGTRRGVRIRAFTDWNGHPAVVLSNGRALAVVDERGWIEVNEPDVEQTAFVVSRQRFEAMFRDTLAAAPLSMIERNSGAGFRNPVGAGHR